jgi:hypothetical protein
MTTPTAGGALQQGKQQVASGATAQQAPAATPAPAPGATAQPSQQQQQQQQGMQSGEASSQSNAQHGALAATGCLAGFASGMLGIGGGTGRLTPGHGRAGAR